MLRLLALVALLSPLASAQTTVSLHAGGAEFDLSGTGSAALVDARVTHSLGRFLTLEGGLGFSNTHQQYGDVAYLLPAVELQAGLPIGRARPYLSAGFGGFVPLSGPGEGTIEFPTYSVTGDFSPDAEGAVLLGLGLDVDAMGPVVIRAAGRLRGTAQFDGPDLFNGTFAELALGLGYRL